MSKWSELIVPRFACGHANTEGNRTTYETRTVRKGGITVIYEGKRCRLCHNAASAKWAKARRAA